MAREFGRPKPVGELKMDVTYKYQASNELVGRELDKIAVDIHLGFAEGQNALGLDIAVTEQNNSGIMYFDARTGRFVNTQIQQRMTLETAVGDHIHQQKLDTRLNMKFTTSRLASKHQPPRALGDAEESCD